MITIECNYSKKLGLPQYSSHQFGITLRTELTNLAEVQAESARLYALLQQSVDTSIQQIGFLPSANGQTPAVRAALNGHSHEPGAASWACSARQRSLILRTAREHGLEDQQLEGLAQNQFRKALSELTKPEASCFISELQSQRNPSGPNQDGRQECGDSEAQQ